MQNIDFIKRFFRHFGFVFKNFFNFLTSCPAFPQNRRIALIAVQCRSQVLGLCLQQQLIQGSMLEVKIYTDPKRVYQMSMTFGTPLQ